MASGAYGADAGGSETTRLSTNGHFSTIIDAERANAFHVSGNMARSSVSASWRRDRQSASALFFPLLYLTVKL